MGVISKLFERRDLRGRLHEERTRRRRLEVAAAYRDAREAALLDVIERFRLEDEAAEALAAASTAGHAAAQRVKAQHERERQ